MQGTTAAEVPCKVSQRRSDLLVASGWGPVKARGTLEEGERDKDVREAAPPTPPWPVSYGTWSGHCQESKPDASKWSLACPWRRACTVQA